MKEQKEQSKSKKAWKLDDEVVKQLASRHREIQHKILSDYKFERKHIS
jgi:hypothetical protein